MIKNERFPPEVPACQSPPAKELVRRTGEAAGRDPPLEEKIKMDKRSLEIAHQLKRDIEKEVNVFDMRIFGSRSRDDFEADSDLDIFIELEENNPEVRKLIGHLTWKIGFENELVITTIIFTRDELENGPMKFSPIYKNIMREGVAV